MYIPDWVLLGAIGGAAGLATYVREVRGSLKRERAARERLEHELERTKEYWSLRTEEMRDLHMQELRQAVSNERGWWTLIEKIRDRQEKELQEFKEGS